MLSRGMRCSDLPHEKSSVAFNRMVYGDGGRQGDYQTRASKRDGFRPGWWLREGTKVWRHALKWTVGLIDGTVSLAQKYGEPGRWWF